MIFSALQISKEAYIYLKNPWTPSSPSHPRALFLHHLLPLLAAFITPVKLLDKTRQRSNVELPFEESERRALLLKKWSLYEHEIKKIFQLRSTTLLVNITEEFKASLSFLTIRPTLGQFEVTKRDPNLFPLETEGPDYTPPISSYQPPEGRYHDITKVYTQVEFKR
ncbi:unnamed protein product [Nyctereutes procyonoides]|uniref:Large ribosomal subunit protein mL40 n=1 Tax=Nyctereutes procyonoides TaxID=34880 RepID=A0A811ZSQ2_NYCPR|nr:unnamed protein product [Nyctereutes procyonoides]